MTSQRRLRSLPSSSLVTHIPEALASRSTQDSAMWESRADDGHEIAGYYSRSQLVHVPEIRPARRTELVPFLPRNGTSSVPRWAGAWDLRQLW